MAPSDAAWIPPRTSAEENFTVLLISMKSNPSRTLPATSVVERSQPSCRLNNVGDFSVVRVGSPKLVKFNCITQRSLCKDQSTDSGLPSGLPLESALNTVLIFQEDFLVRVPSRRLTLTPAGPKHRFRHFRCASKARTLNFKPDTLFPALRTRSPFSTMSKSVFDCVRFFH
jgi:hypothetical protein